MRGFGNGGSRFNTLSKGRRAKRGERNKTEARYELELKADPRVVGVWFEPLTLRLSHPAAGQPAKYTPDFLVLMSDGSTYLDDVKGSGLDDNAAIVRLKCAAELFPLWIFRLAKERRKKDGGGFVVTEV